MKNAPIYSVTQVNQYIKGLLDRDGALAGLFVRGELSNYKAYPSGHHYFSLKDAEGAIRCVMFRREAMGLRFRPENGMKVVAFGRVTVFPRDGQYQLYCSELTPDGVGDLHVAFEQLKQKLYCSTRPTRSPSRAIPEKSPSLPPQRGRRCGICSAYWGLAGRWRRCWCCRCGYRGRRPLGSFARPSPGPTCIGWPTC